MLSRAQQILIKRAQREAGLDDTDYRDALAIASGGCRSSKDPSLTDRHLDLALAYMEAIYWRRTDAGELQPSRRHDAVFRQRGYWAKKNPRSDTSRDRHNGTNLSTGVLQLESELSALGFSRGYCAAIRQKVIQGRSDDSSLYAYAAALRRTLASKRKLSGASCPR